MTVFNRLSRGFTLIEMLVAMSLISMLLAMVYGGFHASTRAVDKGEKMVDRNNHLRIVHRFVRRQLGQMLALQIQPEESSQDDDISLTYFEGDSERIHFAAPMPGYLSAGGPHDQTLFFESGRDGYELLFDHKVLSRDEDFEDFGGEEREPVVLLSGIRRASFSYLTLDDDGEPTEWLDEWEEPSQLPLMIRVEIEMDPATRIVWPTLDIRPRVDGVAGNREERRPLFLPSGQGQRN